MLKNHKLKAMSQLVWDMRKVKDEAELGYIKKAAQLTDLGAKGYSGDKYRLKWWFALCFKLGKGDEAREVVNNLPKELRHPNVIPDYVKERVK